MAEQQMTDAEARKAMVMERGEASIQEEIDKKAKEAAKRLNAALSELNMRRQTPQSSGEQDRLMSHGQLADAEWVITLRHDGVPETSVSAAEWLEYGQEEREKFFAKHIHRVLIAERRQAG